MTDSRSSTASVRPSLFIIGSPRSGTTFLTRMVNRFLDIHVSRDAGVFLRFYRMLPRYGDLSETANMRRLVDDLYQDYFFKKRFLERGLKMAPAALCGELTDRTYSGLIDHILMATARSHGKRGWGNKKPSYSLHVSEINALFPRARFVHIIRDGRDVVLSMRRASNLLLEQNWYFAAHDWRRHVLEGREMGRRLERGRYMEVTYEHVLRDPVAVFSEILTFLDADADEKARLDRIGDGIRGRMKAGNSEKWKREMPSKAIQIAERAAGDVLSALGYELAYPELSGKAFPRPAVWLFRLDRLVRHVFARNVRKVFTYRTQRLLTSSRAVLGHARSAAKR